MNQHIIKSDDELAIGTKIDGHIDMPTQDIEWANTKVQRIVDEAIADKDLEKIWSACREIVKVTRLSGLMLAKTLYLVKKNWDVFEQEDEFEGVAWVMTGLNKYTINRYINVWAMFEENIIPAHLQENILQRNIKDLVPVASAIAQGFDIEPDQWERISDADNGQVIEEITRAIKGTPPRRNSIRMYITKTGDVWAMKGDDKEAHYVGHLEVKSEDEVVRSAIVRIANTIGFIVNKSV